MDTAKIFKNGSSQAVRLPKEFRLPGTEVFVRRVGDMVVLIPKKGVWKGWYENLSEFSEDFMTDRKQPPVQRRKGL